jgi:thiol-disulfide isomerase/thioredoxin
MKSLKKFSGFTLICLLFSTTYAQNNSIKATISGLGNDTVYVMGYPVSKLLESVDDYIFYDTIVSNDNVFSYNPTLNEPACLCFTPKKGQYEIMGGIITVASNQIEINCKPDIKYYVTGQLLPYSIDYSVQGDELNEDMSLLRRQRLPVLENYTRLCLTTAYDSESDKKIREMDATMASILYEYLVNHLDKELGGIILSSFEDNTFMKFYSQLGDAAKNGVFSKPRLDYRFARIAQVKRILPENPAPDFALKTPSGNSLSLYSVEKDYIVLDFWGSWCAPCRAGLPKMAKYYEKYKHRLEIIGISCKDTDDMWKNAIKKFDLKWLQVINNDKNNDVTKLYSITAFPTKIILDRDKKIVAAFVGESDDFYNKLDKLME